MVGTEKTWGVYYLYQGRSQYTDLADLCHTNTSPVWSDLFQLVSDVWMFYVIFKVLYVNT